jgi:hypothetical protein
MKENDILNYAISIKEKILYQTYLLDRQRGNYGEPSNLPVNI